MNECDVADDNSCVEHATCTNNVGSYTCMCDSPAWQGDPFYICYGKSCFISIINISQKYCPYVAGMGR